MPIYEFRCRGCGVIISSLSRLDEDGRSLTCQCCGAEGLEKLFSVFSSPRATVVASAADYSEASCQGCGEANSCARRFS